MHEKKVIFNGSGKSYIGGGGGDGGGLRDTVAKQKDKSAIDIALGELQNSQNILACLVRELIGNLQPVSRPFPEGDTKNHGEPSMCEIHDRILISKEMADDLAERVRLAISALCI